MTTTTMTIPEVRAATFAEFAEKLQAFAARQEAKAPGRMDNITAPALAAAAIAEEVAEAYLVGDPETVKTKRAQYVDMLAAHPHLSGIA